MGVLMEHQITDNKIEEGAVAKSLLEEIINLTGKINN
jgi:hypothetical protein